MRRLRIGTLESRFYFIFTLIFFATILVLQVVSFRFTASAVRDATLVTKTTLLRELVERIDTYVADMNQIVRVVLADRAVRDYLAAGADPGDSVPPGTRTALGSAASARPVGESAKARADIEDRLGHYIEVRQDISSIFLIRADQEILAVTGRGPAEAARWARVQGRRWYRNTVAAAGRPVVTGSYVQNLVVGEYPWVVSVSRQIVDEDGKALGVLLVDLKFNRIREISESLVVGDNGYIFIVDEEGRYVFHPAQQLVYSGIRSEPLEALLGPREADDVDTVGLEAAGSHYMLTVSPATGWRVVSVSRNEDFVAGWGYVQFTYASLGLVLFVVVGLMTNFISKGITRPLRELQGVMNSVETGEFLPAGDLKATDEVRELAKEYDIMVGRIRYLMAANAQEQEKKRKSDLKALQAQINPHFLYNTLDSIVWMAEMNKSAEVVRMTSALSKLFRVGINRGEDIVPLRLELEHVESYLTIQKMRYEDRFRYDIDVDPSLLTRPVLKIILQPLVENAIYHGIRDADGPGLIRIRAEESSGSLVLRVEDNGVGMNEAELVALRRRLEYPDMAETPGNGDRPQGEAAAVARHNTSGHTGMGFRNVHERIRLYYGEGYGLTVDSSPGCGTVITARLPSSSREVDALEAEAEGVEK